MQRFKHCLAGMVLLTVILNPVGAETEVISISHRLPEEIAKIVTPLLEPKETVVVVPAGLVVKAQAARIEEIRKLVEKLDRRLKQLTITVLQSQVLTLDELNARAAVMVQVPSDQSIRGRGHVYRSLSGSQEGSRQTLKTLEGQPAYIVVGQEQPVPVVAVYGYPLGVVGGIDYRPVTRGFKVVPMMAGCRVRLAISPWSGRMNGKGDGSIDVQAAETTMEVDLGHWVELGAVSDDLEANETRWGYGSTTRRRRSQIFVRVDSADGC